MLAKIAKAKVRFPVFSVVLLRLSFLLSAADR